MAQIKNFVELLFAQSPSIWSGPIDFKRYEFLREAGQKETHLFFIETGAVRAFYIAENQEHTIRLGYKNNVINALPSFLSGNPSTLFIQALKKTTVRIAQKEDVLALKNSSALHLNLWNEMLEVLFLQQFEREVDLLTASPEERYFRVLKRSPKLFQEIPAKYIAEYLRMTPETLSRLKKS